jgi:hypothetical protein
MIHPTPHASNPPSAVPRDFSKVRTRPTLVSAKPRGTHVGRGGRRLDLGRKT